MVPFQSKEPSFHTKKQWKHGNDLSVTVELFQVVNCFCEKWLLQWKQYPCPKFWQCHGPLKVFLFTILWVLIWTYLSLKVDLFRDGFAQPGLSASLRRQRLSLRGQVSLEVIEVSLWVKDIGRCSMVINNLSQVMGHVWCQLQSSQSLSLHSRDYLYMVTEIQDG